MKTRILISGITCLSIFLIAFDTADITSAGAPLGSTGAPGEQTCAKAGCHIGNAVNSGMGNMAILFNNNITTYEPGKTYNISVLINQLNISRFGFQLVVLNKDGISTGVIEITDTIRTQVFKGTNQYTGKNYLTYTLLGTKFSSTGLGQWQFKWTAPDKDVGPVTIYAATVAANDDGTDKGDWVYTDAVTVLPNTLGISALVNEAVIVSVFPNPVKNKFKLVYTANEALNTNIELRTISNKLVAVLWGGKSNKGSNDLELSVNPDISKGIYLLILKSGEAVTCKKIIIQ